MPKNGNGAIGTTEVAMSLTDIKEQITSMKRLGRANILEHLIELMTQQDIADAICSMKLGREAYEISSMIRKQVG